MSGYYNQSENPDGYGDSGGGGLRKQLEEALGEIRSLRQQIDGQARQKTVTALLKDKGLDPAISELIPADADPAKWIEEKGHLLGVQPARTSENANEAPQPGTEPEIHAAVEDDPAVVAERQALADMQNAAEDGSQAVVDTDLFDRMNKIQSEDELLAFFRSNGMA